MRKRINYIKDQVLGDFGVRYIKDVYVKNTKTRVAMFNCVCGNTFKSSICDVKSNHTKSCGCLVLKHGMSKSREYVIWSNIKARCYNNQHKSYPDYGGRGINMSDEFRDNPILFSEYIKTLDKSDGINNTIDRINNDLGYKRGNLRWATRTTQAINQRKRKNRTGYTGVKKRTTNKWESGINYNKKFHYIGMFNSDKEAVLARNDFILKNNFPHAIQDINQINTRV